MKILLLNPAPIDHWYAKTSGAFLLPQNTLPALASLTPEHEVKIVDELVDTVDLDEPADVVGITSMTDNALRAYQLADAFRHRGVPVVMGGAHPTAVPDEALEHADAVVVGEAEGVWESIVEAVRAGRRPSGAYKADQLANIEGAPPPRRDLLKLDRYLPITMVQTSRGCPYTCEFCSVNSTAGGKFRHRPVREVIEEIERDAGEQIFFVDDIINGDPRYARQLFRELIPLKKKWGAQFTINIGRDEELCDLMAKAGCYGAFIGFESVNEGALRGMRKPQNKVQRYDEHIKRVHGAGVTIYGSFVFGTDQDGPDCFAQTLDFALEQQLEIAQFTILTPLPGTDLYSRWDREGRLLWDRWWVKHHFTEVVYNPVGLTRAELREGWIWTNREWLKMGRVARRVANAIALRGDLVSGIWVAGINWSYRKALGQVPAVHATAEPAPIPSVRRAPSLRVAAF